MSDPTERPPAVPYIGLIAIAVFAIWFKCAILLIYVLLGDSWTVRQKGLASWALVLLVLALFMSMKLKRRSGS